MDMFCYQCQEAARNTGCTVQGVCGKQADTARLQDLLIYLTKGLALVDQANRSNGSADPVIAQVIMENLFTTITNANFDNEAIAKRIQLTIDTRNASNQTGVQHPAATMEVGDESDMLNKAEAVGVLSEENEDIRSLKELITYGLKGLCAYNDHARKLGYADDEINHFVSETLAALLEEKELGDWVALTLKTGEYGVKVMALLDKANTETYGHPEMTQVNIGTRNNPAILISGHDLHDMKMLLEQTKGTGVDVYTHGEMLPANYYPEFKQYDHFVGNYGGSWWMQKPEFESFNGPILFTTNCIVPPLDSYKNRVFTTGSCGYPGFKHIEPDAEGNKDFSEIIELAKTLPAPLQIEEGTIVGGFAHNQVLALADTVVEAVQSGAIKQFYVMAGCDGRQKARNYYTEFAQALDPNTIILTAGCAKYRYNKLDLGDIGGVPRVLDAGQCNDSYSLAVIAITLQKVLGLEDINQLPIVYNIAWYEQKAVIVLLALLSLGVKNIHLGPTLPAFLSPNVTNVLVENFGIAGIDTVENDIQKFRIA